MPLPGVTSGAAGLDPDCVEPLPPWFGYLLTATTAALVVPGVLFRSGRPTVPALIAGIITVAAAVVLERRAGVASWVPAAVIVAGVLVVAGGESSNVVWFVMVMLGGCIESRGGSRSGNAFLVIMALLYGTLAVVNPDPGWAAWATGTLLAVGGSRAGWHQRALVVELRAAQAELAERAAAEERNRIARELHDVIAHTLTVSLLHITSARLAVEHDPDDAVAALAEAERLGRDSLNEVRRAVGLLRDQAGGTGTDPLPTLSDLGGLISGFTDAGLSVELDVAGDPGAVPPAVGLSAYRIVQEAVTNAAKHAAGQPVSVHVRIDGGGVAVEVVNAIPPGAHHGAAGGLGVVGMRERAELLGGALTAGPLAHGWTVSGRIPATAGRPAPVTRP